MKIRAVRKAFAVGVGLVMVGSAVAACGSEPGEGSETITLPIIDSFSGVGAPYGTADKYSYELAKKEINDAGGIEGRRLELKYYDDQSSPSVGVQQLRKIPNDALAVGGVALSSVGAGVATGAKSAQIPFVTGSISDQDIIATGRPWTFSTLPPVQFTLAPMVTDWVRQLGEDAENVAVIYDDKNAATQKQGQIMVNALRQAGAKVLKTVHAETAQPSYSSQAAAVAATKPDAVAACALAADSASMVKEMRSAGVTGDIVLCPATTNSTFADLLGKQITDVTLAWNWWPTLPGENNQKFTEAYKAVSGGQLPSASGPTSYEAIKLLAEALTATKAVSSSDPVAKKREAIRDYLANVKNFQGVNGTKSMGPNGTMEQPGVLLSYDRGNIAERSKSS